MATLLKTERGRLPEAPYPGLRPFEPHEWSIFFGREVMTAAVIEQLGSQNLIIVHGASGCGKSSLVRAGVLPALQVDHDLNGSRFQHGIIRPSQGPLEALAAAFEANLGPVDDADPSKSWLNRIVIDDDLLATVNARLQRLDSSFCLIVDQFEEIFRWVEEEDPSQAESLVELLVDVAQNRTPGCRFFVLATMRSDYLGQCARFPGFAKVVNDCQYLLDNLDDFGMLRAIHEPARRFGGRVDPDLADRLRAAAQSDPDPLPILQHSLMRIYDAVAPTDSGWRMTLDQLSDVSNEQGALSFHAEEIYNEVVGTDENPEARADAVEWVFRALVDRDGGGRAIRRPTTFEELVAVSAGDETLVRDIVEAFSRKGRNLLVVSRTEHGGRVRVDVSHEALIRRWERIGDERIDAETGMPRGWLLREVEAGLIWKAWAVFAKQGEKCLDSRATKQWLPLFNAIEKRPAWAKRYLQSPVPELPVEEQPEWLAVIVLIKASRENLRIEDNRFRKLMKRYWAMLVAGFFLLFAATTASAFYLWQQGKDTKQQLSDGKVQLDKYTDRTWQLQRQMAASAEQRNALRVRIAALDEQRQISKIALTKQLTATEHARREANRTLAAARQQMAAVRLQLANARGVLERETAKSEKVKKGLTDMMALQMPTMELPADYADGTRSLFVSLAADGGDAELASAVAAKVESYRTSYGLTDERRLALFATMVAGNSSRFSGLKDKLDLSAEALVREYPYDFQTAKDAAPFAHNPSALTRRLMGRSGDPRDNGDPAKYIGRGLIRLRGRSGYGLLQDFIGKKMNVDLLATPEKLEDLDFAVRAALEIWKALDGNAMADKLTEDSLGALQRAIGGDADSELQYMGHIAQSRTLVREDLQRRAPSANSLDALEAITADDLEELESEAEPSTQPQPEPQPQQ